ncbi:MAG: hypothetical protein IBX55_17235 [Methyloprofundus sp.]|nr:hypothetical protein [Methyloprofundus sp.]
MKRTVLATAIVSAMLGLTACMPDSQNNTASNEPTAVSSSNLSTASASFSVGFPQSEVSAAFIGTQVATIQLNLIRVDQVFNAIAQYESSGGVFPWYMLEGYYEYEYRYENSSIYDLYESYKTKAQVTEQEARDFGRIATALANYLYTHSQTLDFQLPDPVVSVELTPTDNSATLGNLLATGYIVFAEQYDGTNQLIAYEAMPAFLGEGSNAIALNMMSANWTFVDASDNPQPFVPTLLTSDMAKAKWLYNDTTERNMVEFLTDGQFNQIGIKSIQRLNHGAKVASLGFDGALDAQGNPMDLTQVFIMSTLSNATENKEEQIRGGVFEEYESVYDDTDGPWIYGQYIEDEVRSDFYQVYDARLTSSKVLQGGDFMSISADVGFDSSASSQYTWAELFIVGDLGLGEATVVDGVREYESEEDSDYYQWSRTYYDQDGAEQTLYIVNQWNWKNVLQTPSDHADLTQVTPISVLDGQTIQGWALEVFSSHIYDSQHWYDNATGISQEEAQQNKPTHDPTSVLMAYAMGSISQTQGLTASAQAHALGENCATVSMNWVDKNFTYGWIDGQWQVGVVNESAISWNSQTGRDEFNPEFGDDLNGDGVVSPFEVGVVYNYTFDDMQTTSTGQDLDGDGVVDQYEAVGGLQYTEEEVMDVCATPVRLKASPLTIEREAFIYNQSETDETTTSGDTVIEVS